MDFDAVISAVVPAGFLADVQDILVGMNFTSILASQAWELCRRLVVVVGRLVVGLFKIYMRTPRLDD